MHSLKHTVIAVILLGVSFGLYQISLTPATDKPATKGHLKSGMNDPVLASDNESSLFRTSQLNTGEQNTGEQNTGEQNTGEQNTGEQNTVEKITSEQNKNELTTGNLNTEKASANIAVAKLVQQSNLSTTNPSAISVPNLSELGSIPGGSSVNPPSTPQLTIPQLPQLPADVSSNLPSKPMSSTDRKPIEASIVNGVQAIHYPDNLPSDASNNSQVVQREPLNESRDQGLLDALKGQTVNAPTHSGSGTVGQDFVATVPKPVLPMSDDKSLNFVSTTPPSDNGSALKPSALDFRPAGSVPSEPDSVRSSDSVKNNTGDFVSVGELSRPAPLNSSSPDKPVGDFVNSPTDHTPGAPTYSAPTLSPTLTAAEMAQYTIKTVWNKVDELVAAEDYHSALKLLSRFYKDESLNGPQRQRLIGWLDALAAKVIFSSEDHLTGRPYAMDSQETLGEVAKRWQIPVQLISNVQGETLLNRQVVPAGTRLKEIPGPFHAELKLKARVVTLYLGDLYAGRFPVVIGTSGEPRPGTYEVVLKSESGYSWYDEHGKEYPPSSVENGYGPHWIGLSGSLCLHAVADNTAEGHRGCIGLSSQDAADLFSILSETSKLTIIP